MFNRLPSIPLRRCNALYRPIPSVRFASVAPHTAPSHVDDPPQDSHDSHHGGHESHYDPPTGWLWGIRPGDKYEKEGWEDLFIYGFFGSLILTGIAYAFKPDTSIQTWALEEARRRLEKEGILEDPDAKK